MCHAFHRYSGKEKFKKTCIDKIYVDCKNKAQYLWDNDEELYTISGFYWKNGKCFDPICCNMFAICENLQTLDSVVQRIFHRRYYFKDKATSKMTDVETYCTGWSIDVEEFKINADEYIKKTLPELPERIFPKLPAIFTRSEKRPKSPLFSFAPPLIITPLLKKGR
jgi:hypothetical protein